MTIIGHGDIASVLGSVDRDDRLYFASGVSNSSETKESEYWRELDLLLSTDTHRNKHIVYFSSLCVFYSNTRYANHKKQMENYVRCMFLRNTIIRMGNITWGSNPHTLINFLTRKIDRGEPYEIQDVYRYVVDKEEFLHWMNLIPPWPCELNIPGRMMKVKDIIREYCIPRIRRDDAQGKRDHSVQELQFPI